MDDDFLSDPLFGEEGDMSSSFLAGLGAGCDWLEPLSFDQQLECLVPLSPVAADSSAVSKRGRDEEETLPTSSEDPTKKGRPEPPLPNGTEVVLTRKGSVLCKTRVILWEERNYLLLSQVERNCVPGQFHKHEFEVVLQYGISERDAAHRRVKYALQSPTFQEKFETNTIAQYKEICVQACDTLAQNARFEKLLSKFGGSTHSHPVLYALDNPKFRKQIQKGALGSDVLKKRDQLVEAYSVLAQDKEVIAWLNARDKKIRSKVAAAFDKERGRAFVQGKLVMLKSGSSLRMERADFDQYEQWVSDAEHTEVYKAVMNIANCLISRDTVVPLTRAYFKDVAQHMQSRERFMEWINCNNLKWLVRQDWFLGYLPVPEAQVLLTQVQELDRVCMRFSNGRKGHITVLPPGEPKAAFTWDPMLPVASDDPVDAYVGKDNVRGFPLQAFDRFHYKKK